MCCALEKKIGFGNANYCLLGVDMEREGLPENVLPVQQVNVVTFVRP